MTRLRTSFLIIFILALCCRVAALGINCRGSGLCPRASWNNKNDASIIQVLRDVVWASSKSNDTVYQAGDHIVCVSQSQHITIEFGFTGPPVTGFSPGASIGLDGNINEGGICLFPQDTSLTLGAIRPLVDAILDHHCTTCGSVPIHFVDRQSNDPGDGILTFNYVASPTCDRDCIQNLGSPQSGKGNGGSSRSSSPITTDRLVTVTQTVKSPATTSKTDKSSHDSSLRTGENSATTGTATITVPVSVAPPSSTTKANVHSGSSSSTSQQPVTVTQTLKLPATTSNTDNPSDDSLLGTSDDTATANAATANTAPANTATTTVPVTVTQPPSTTNANLQGGSSSSVTSTTLGSVAATLRVYACLEMITAAIAAMAIL